MSIVLTFRRELHLKYIAAESTRTLPFRIDIDHNIAKYRACFKAGVN
jgi:hypothetical protein